MSRKFKSENSVESFMRHVSVQDGGCWIWKNKPFWDGYGQFNFKHEGKWKKERAHRSSYRFFKGEAGGKLVCHSCDKPLCVNPDHLFLGTPLDNTRDMDSKGRRVACGLVGELHPLASITEAEARDIKYSASYRGITKYFINKYGVSRHVVSQIRSKKNWKHV